MQLIVVISIILWICLYLESYSTFYSSIGLFWSLFLRAKFISMYIIYTKRNSSLLWKYRNNNTLWYFSIYISNHCFTAHHYVSNKIIQLSLSINEFLIRENKLYKPIDCVYESYLISTALFIVYNSYSIKLHEYWKFNRSLLLLLLFGRYYSRIGKQYKEKVAK